MVVDAVCVRRRASVRVLIMEPADIVTMTQWLGAVHGILVLPVPMQEHMLEAAERDSACGRSRIVPIRRRS